MPSLCKVVPSSPLVQAEVDLVLAIFGGAPIIPAVMDLFLTVFDLASLVLSDGFL